MDLGRICFANTAALLAMAFAASAATAGELNLEDRRLKTPDGREYIADMGTFTVAENRADPDSQIIELGVMRVKSPNPNAGAPIFVLAGGPGGSSIGNMRGYLNATPDLLELGDLVAVDQRGVGRSRPSLSKLFMRALPLEVPQDSESLEAARCEVVEEAKAYWREQGVDLRGYTTPEAADDINAVREALGYDSMRLFGRSYGTHLAFSIIRRHGDRVTSAVLQGVEGPDHTYKTPSQIQAGLEALDALVAADETLNESIPSLIQLVRDVLAKFDQGPIFVQVDLGGSRGVQTIALSKFDIQFWAANAIGRISNIEDVPSAFYAMAHDDFSAMGALAAPLRTVAVTSAMSAATDCASGMTNERREQIAREAGETLLGDVVNFPYPDECECWDVPKLGDEFRGPLRSAVPILMMCGDLDSRTPIANARELRPNLSNATLLVVRNAGHDTRLFTSPEAVAAAVTFFRDGSVNSEVIDMPAVEFSPLPSVD